MKRKVIAVALIGCVAVAVAGAVRTSNMGPSPERLLREGMENMECGHLAESSMKIRMKADKKLINLMNGPTDGDLIEIGMSCDAKSRADESGHAYCETAVTLEAFGVNVRKAVERYSEEKDEKSLEYIRVGGDEWKACKTDGKSAWAGKWAMPEAVWANMKSARVRKDKEKDEYVVSGTIPFKEVAKFVAEICGQGAGKNGEKDVLELSEQFYDDNAKVSVVLDAATTMAKKVDVSLEPTRGKDGASIDEFSLDVKVERNEDTRVNRPEGIEADTGNAGIEAESATEAATE